MTTRSHAHREEPAQQVGKYPDVAVSETVTFVHCAGRASHSESQDVSEA